MSWLQESVTYQAILAEGRQEGREEGREIGRALEAQRLVLRLGERRFGPPTPSMVAAVEGITDIDRLEQLSLELLTATGWDDLLGENATR